MNVIMYQLGFFSLQKLLIMLHTIFLNIEELGCDLPFCLDRDLPTPQSCLRG